MTVWKQFEENYSIDNLKKVYENIVLISPATGIDNMSHKILWSMLDEQLGIIHKKVIAGDYKFTKYKLKLISKGRGKSPREISIPTIRDKIVLRVMCDFLQKRFESAISFELPQDIVKKVKNDILSANYNCFIKLDISNFYPTIRHDFLISRIKNRIRDKVILSLLDNAIKTPTVIKSHLSDKPCLSGVPQGLSISNVLASLFLLNIDNRYKNRADLKYYRYVDDILILCNTENTDEIASDIIKRFTRLGLKVHDPKKNPEKSTIGTICSDQFSYLGYSFEKSIVTAKKNSILKLRESILSIFTTYKYSQEKSEAFLEWRLNLRITGCVFENKNKGWLFFFSEINDEKMLHQLDSFVKTLCKRFSVNISLKSFVRTYFQIKHNKYSTQYLPNFDQYSQEQMVHVLSYYFKISTKNLTEDEVKYEFRRKISKQVKELETDIQNYS